LDHFPPNTAMRCMRNPRAARHARISL
jgi:hypothetical protein